MNTDDQLIKYLLREADPIEQTRFEQWLAAGEANRERFRQYTAIWELSDRIIPSAPAWQEAYARFRQRLRQDRLARPVDEQSRGVGSVLYRWPRGWQIAALLTGFVCLAGVLYRLRKSESNTGAPVALITITKAGPATLPDGSVIRLESNTTISYTFGRQATDRNVYLKGQAFFSIAADPTKPFVIHVRALTIKVLGTSFTVRETGDSTVVEMASGVVEVSKGRERRVIRAGDTLRTYRDELLINHARTDGSPDDRKTSTIRRAKVSTAGNPAPASDTVIRRDDQRAIVRSIIRDMVREKIVSGAADIIWFGLDDGQFIVNDRRMPDSLLIKFRSKYIRPDGLGYYYGSVKVTGQGYFFTKQELNGQ